MAQKFHSDIQLIGSSTDLSLQDGGIIKLGTDVDFKMQHNGTNTILENYTGNLYIDQNLNDGDIIFRNDDGSGALDSYIRIDGSTVETLFLKRIRLNDNVEAHFGTARDLKIYHNGTDSVIENNTGDLYIENTADDSDIIFKSDDINLGSGTPTEYFRLDGSTRKVEYSVPLHSTSSAHFEAESGVGLYGGGYGTFSISNSDDNYQTVFGYDGGAFSYIDGQIRLLDYGSGNETGTAAYNLAVTSDGDIIEVSTTGDSETAERIEVTVKNVSGGSLSKGTVVHAAPTATPPSGNVIEVIAADANVAANMPAIGVLNETIANEAEGAAVMFGAVSGIDTSSFNIGDELYVSTTAGEFTATKPTATTELVQKIAVVIKSHASNGLIKVFGAGRSNDVPNQIDRNVNFTDNSKLTFGDSTTPDLQIYHDGSNSWIRDTNAGNLYLDTNGSFIGLVSDGSFANGKMGLFYKDGAVELYYDNAKKFETTSTGVTVTGGINTSGNFINVGNGQGNSENYLQLGHSRTGNGFAYIDLIGDTTYTDFGLRIIRGNTGANAASTIEHKGTGNFSIKTTEAANLRLQTANTTALTLDSSQNATFAGTIASGTQTITSATDQILTLDQTGGGWNYIGFESDSTRNFYVGQDGNENFIIGSDNSLDFHITGFDEIKYGASDLINTGNILPNVDSTYDLGSTSLYWRNIYADNIISEGGDAEFQKVYKDTVTINESTYTTVATVNGNSLASAVRLNVSGVGSSSVINVDAKIMVNHYRDILIKSTSTYYKKLYIKITSDNNEDFAIELKKDTGGATSQGVNIEIIPLNSEEITITSSHSISGTTHEHIAEYGESQSSNDADAGHDYHYWLKDDNAKLKLGAGQDLQLYHDGSNSYINETGTGSLITQASDYFLRVGGTNNTNNALVAANGGTVTLYYANAAKFATYTSGTSTTGNHAISSGSKLQLRGTGDGNHYVRYASSGFSGVTIDGPQVVGHQGGELGTNLSGDNYSLRWNNSGDVFVRNDATVNGASLILGSAAYEKVLFESNPSSHDGNGSLFIEPQTAPGSGTANFYTRFSNKVSGGTTKHHVQIAGGSNLYFGGSLHTYIGEDVDDRLRFFCGGAEFMRFTESTTNETNLYTNVNVTGHIKPVTANAYTIGDDTYYWNNVTTRSLSTTGTADRTKIRVWAGSTYGIGMKNGFNYGHVNNSEYAMTFQMNSNDNRGFWWGDSSHSDSQGAMSLSTNGRLTVATSISVGEGESITSPSSVPLYVNGAGTANAATLKINNQSSSAYNHSIEAFAPNMTATETNVILVGVAGSTKNSAYIGYKFQASGSNDNLLTFGHWASDHLLNIMGNGNVGISTESPNYRLDVNGSLRGASNIYAVSTYAVVLDSNTGAGPQITFGSTSDFDQYGRIAQQSSKFQFITQARNFEWLNGTSSLMTLNTSGRLGIGRANPTQKLLEVEGGILVNASRSGTDEDGIFFRDSFVTANKYNCSILAKDHNGSFPDGISINGYDGVSICTGSNNRNQRMIVDVNGNILLNSSTAIANRKLRSEGGYSLEGGGYNTSYTSDGLYGGSATPNILSASTGQQLRLGYLDNGSGLYSTAYVFETKSTDGLSNTVEKEALIVKNTNSGNWVSHITNLGTGYFTKLGVGVTSPGERIHVKQNTNAHLVSKLEQDNASYQAWFEANSQDNSFARFGIGDNGDDFAFINTNESDFKIFMNSQEKFRINTNGDFVFNTLTAVGSSQMTLYTTQTYGITVQQNKSNSSSDFCDTMFLQNVNQNNANSCKIGMSTNGTDGQHHRVTLAAERDTSANYRGEFSIHIRQSDASHPKRLKLDYNGNLTVSGDVIAYGSPSDKRLKENIKPINNALDTVQKLQGVTFDWKESKSLLDIKNDIGFIAQDVKEVLPELVRENEDGQMSLRDKGIVPVLVEAIKELKAEIEELKSELKK